MEIPDKPLSISSSSSSSPSYEITEEIDTAAISTDLTFDGADEIFNDCVCVVCKRMDTTPRNRLVECSDCHSLYHQECHKPLITEADAINQENSWSCTLCKNKVPETAAASTSTALTSPAKPTTTGPKISSKNYESSSSSSSSSSLKAKASTSSSKSSDHKSSKSESTVEASSSSSSSSKRVTPNIKIIPSSERSSSKKSSKSHDSKRKK